MGNTSYFVLFTPPELNILTYIMRGAGVNQWLANIFCKEPGSKYFQLCVLFDLGLCCRCLTLEQKQSQKIRKHMDTAGFHLQLHCTKPWTRSSLRLHPVLTSNNSSMILSLFSNFCFQVFYHRDLYSQIRAFKIINITVDLSIVRE